MKGYAAALRAEFLKARRSKVVWITAIVFSLMPIIGGLFMFIMKDPERARQLGLIGAKAQLFGGDADWPSYLQLIYQIVGGAGLVVFGFIAVWVFGREYSDRTLKDLLALPTPRWAIVAAKLTLIVVWSALLGVWGYGLGIGVGLAVNIPGWSADIPLEMARTLAIICGLTIVVITPVLFVANATRCYLPSIGFLILLLVLANVLSTMGWGGYYPWAAPILHAEPLNAPAAQLNAWTDTIALLTGAAGLTATFVWWYHADQTR